MSAPRSLFITGASGFVGRRVLERVRPSDFERVVVLTRRAIELPSALRDRPEFEVIQGDLLKPERYVRAIDDRTAVIHLAARTGHASAAEFERANIAGTAAVLEACEATPAHRLLFVSTIAAGFADVDGYPYARSKQVAEASIRSAGLPWLIVRPTIVLGPGSPIAGRLRLLARGPISVVPGDGRARVQPIHVDDLAAILLDLATTPDPPGPGTYDVGGPDVLTMAELLRKIQRASFGRGIGPLPLPLRPVLAALRAAESLVPGALPIGVGQFRSFIDDGVVTPNPVFESYRESLEDVDGMVQELVSRPDDR